ncbi:transcription factor SRM1-like [Daucus carota subsp. sativus]|uniref:transcription factor SRM1-like n=1 Tax=Daucus carota subsp. sativus TaxID=79200 RepID=UPI0030827173
MDQLCSQDIPPHENENEAYTIDKWSFKETKLFETIMEKFEENGSMAFFEEVAISMPWRSMSSIKNHYNILINDIKLIKSSNGQFEDIVSEVTGEEEDCETINMEDTNMELEGGGVHKIPRPKKRGIPWSIQEHKSFLEGYKTCGKGEWKKISKDFVPSKTPSQVASHAQKYEKRLHTDTPPEKRRQTINDIRCLCCDSGPCKFVATGSPA